MHPTILINPVITPFYSLNSLLVIIQIYAAAFFDLIRLPAGNSISTVSRPECPWGAMHNLIIDETHLLQPPSSVRSCVNVKAPRAAPSTKSIIGAIRKRS